MTTAFTDAAETMARALGVPDYDFPIIEHPVSSASDDALRVRAQAVCAFLRERLDAVA